MTRVMILTDNEFVYNTLLSLKEQITRMADFSFRYSFFNTEFVKKYSNCNEFLPVNIKGELDDLKKNYDLIISWHCKQLFPKELIDNIRCINVHPGFNPYNRGWFPQVFSIINKKPCGVTIHEIDELLDHGNIIYRQLVKIENYDTSYTVYMKILYAEIELFKRNMQTLINGKYEVIHPEHDGNINYKSDYNKLLEIKLDRKGTFGEFIDILRALTHGKYQNAFFIDDNNEKIFVSINLEKEFSQ